MTFRAIGAIKIIMSKNNGFTLIEMMIAVAIIAILMAIAVPSFQDFIRNNRISSEYNQMIATLQAARGEAIKRGTTITVCASTDGASCAGTSWETGSIAFADIDEDASVDAGVDDVFNVRAASTSPRITIRSVQFGNGGFMQFTSAGFSAGSDNGTFKICDTPVDNLRAKAINVAATGRISKAKDTGADNIVNDVTNVNIACP